MIRTPLAQNRPLSSARPLTILASPSLAIEADSSDVSEKQTERKAKDLEEEEERETGEIAWTAYTGYIKAMGNPLWAIIIFGSLILGQLANVANSLMLGFWSGGSIDGWDQGQYMGVYAGFGVLMAACVVSQLKYLRCEK
jgi:ATP-binding cassette subfamily C (CFTR/MRP) protein 1